MTTPRAADLPVGSVVATDRRVYLKICDDPEIPWIYTEGESMYVNSSYDDEIDDVVNEGAQVLRVGDGGER